jgi:protocatechuate 3,4-dioxygenase beta subunit
MHGIIRDLVTHEPIPNVTFDMWQASSNGKYDFQDPAFSDNNLRGKFKTDDKGEYRLYCLRPTAYSLPTDGPSWKFLQAVDRHPMRPAHIHLMVSQHPHNHPPSSSELTQTSNRSPTKTTSPSSPKSTPKTTPGSPPIPSSPSRTT